MNGKKAKALRKIARDMGVYKKEPNYAVLNETPKPNYYKDATGRIQMQESKKITITNKNRNEYRKLKESYLNGEFEIGYE